MAFLLLIGDVKQPDHYAKIFANPTAEASPNLERMEAVLFHEPQKVHQGIAYDCDIVTCVGLEGVRAQLDAGVGNPKPFDLVLLDQNLGKPAELFEFMAPFAAKLSQSLIITLGQHYGQVDTPEPKRFDGFEGHWINLKKPISIRTLRQVVDCFLFFKTRLMETDLGREKPMVDQAARERAASAEKLQKAERALLRQKKQLAMVAHELRTPLNGMTGILESLLRSKSLHADQAQMVQTVFENTDILGLMLNEILDMSAFESKAWDFTIKQKPFCLTSLIEDLFALQEPLLRDKNLTFYCRIKDDVPCFLEGDVLRLRQVLLNLTSNAVKFTDQGSIRLEITKGSVAEQKEDKVLLHFIVQDSGIGIPEAEVRNLFKPFQQLENAIGRGTGVGLGLAICKQLVERMAGKIWVQSDLGKGSQFHFEIPFTISSEDAYRKIKQPNEVLEAAPIEPATTDEGRSRVLVVEDHPTNAKVARLHLEQEGAEVTWVENGQMAVDLLKENPGFDLIIMDIQMPVLDGIEATKAIRGELGLTIPIIAMTANMLEQNKGVCFEVGMNDFITKPVRRARYQELFKKWLNPVRNQPNSKTADESIEKATEETKPNNTQLFTIEQHPLDIDQAIAEFEGDAELVQTLIQQWVPQCEKDLKSIWQYIKQEDWTAVASFAHRLKGAAGNICAHPLAEEARTLEHAAKLNGQHHDIEALFIQLQRRFGVLLSYLQWRQFWQPERTSVN